MSQNLFHLQDLHGEGIIVSPRMMADHMPDYLTSVLGRLARDRRRQNPNLMESHGPAVGSGAEGTTGNILKSLSDAHSKSICR